MKLVEANSVLLLVLLSYVPSPYISNLVKDYLSNIRTHESIFMSSFIRHLRRSVKFWQHRKNCEVDSEPKLQEQSRFSVLKIVVEFMFSKTTQA